MNTESFEKTIELSLSTEWSYASLLHSRPDFTVERNQGKRTGTELIESVFMFDLNKTRRGGRVGGRYMIVVGGRVEV